MNNLRKLDFVENQADSLKQRIDRMLGHKKTRVKVGQQTINIRFPKDDIKHISRLCLPSQIGQLKIKIEVNGLRK